MGHAGLNSGSGLGMLTSAGWMWLAEKVKYVERYCSPGGDAHLGSERGDYVILAWLSFTEQKAARSEH